MNTQQHALLESLSEENTEDVAVRVVRYIAPDITERYYQGRGYESALATIRGFAEKYVREGNASVVLELPDGGISRLTLWIQNGQLQMELVSPQSSQRAHQLWDSKGYSSEWLPIPQAESERQQHSIFWYFWPGNWFK